MADECTKPGCSIWEQTLQIFLWCSLIGCTIEATYIKECEAYGYTIIIKPERG